MYLVLTRDFKPAYATLAEANLMWLSCASWNGGNAAIIDGDGKVLAIVGDAAFVEYAYRFAAGDGRKVVLGATLRVAK